MTRDHLAPVAAWNRRINAGTMVAVSAILTLWTLGGNAHGRLSDFFFSIATAGLLIVLSYRVAGFLIERARRYEWLSLVPAIVPNAFLLYTLLYMLSAPDSMPKVLIFWLVAPTYVGSVLLLGLSFWPLLRSK